MMVVVALAVPPGERHGLVHRFHNFGEDVFTWLRDKKGAGGVNLGEIDGASGQFTIRDVKAAMLRTLTSWLEEEARRQHLPIALDVQRQ
jgi:hypothetical protein